MSRFFLFSLISFKFFLWSGSLAMASNPSGLSLVGVIADRNEKQSIAVITAANRQTHFLHQGDAVPGMNSYRIHKINRNHVVVSDGRREVRLEYQGSTASGQSFARNTQSSFSDDRSAGWNNRQQEAHYQDNGYQDDGYQMDDMNSQRFDEPDQYDNQQDFDQAYIDREPPSDGRPRQIPGLILRNRGQMHQGRGAMDADQVQDDYHYDNMQDYDE